MRFLIDECTGKKLSVLLKKAGHDVIFVGDIIPGVSNGEVIAKAEKENRILITDDKDFGELVFRLKRPIKGVILLRTSTIDPHERFDILRFLFDNHKVEGKFIVVKDDRIKIREI
ncbi:MAG: DUF5615 family PIN-like protein [Thermoplasmata archaeon]|nr:MAG: DUF5615 family PIN-like protein [Thermoplasmata archaeon]